MIKQTIIPAKIIIIPGWIYKRILRNKLNIVDISNYSKLREILSLSDLAEWRFLNDEYKVDDCFLSSSLLFTHNEDGAIFIDTNITNDQKKEVHINLDYLTKSTEIQNSCLNKLNTVNNYNERHYSFIPYSNNILFLIVDEGFNLYLKENKLDFMRDYIKNCYNMMPEHEVSSLSAYGIYLRQLALG